LQVCFHDLSASHSLAESAPETDLQKTIEGAAPEAPPERNISLLDNLFLNVLSNPFIWGLAFTYFCVYVVRQGITSWSVFYLIKEKGVLDAGAAAARFHTTLDA